VQTFLQWKTIKYYILYVSVVLIIQHAMRMLCIILSSVTCLAFQYFSTFSHKLHNFRKNKLTGHKMRVLIFCATFVWNILHCKGTERDVIKIYVSLPVKNPILFSEFNETWIFAVRSVRAELFHADRRTDRHVKTNSLFFAILRAGPKTSDQITITLYSTHGRQMAFAWVGYSLEDRLEQFTDKTSR